MEHGTPESFGDLTVREFAARLASATPAPGGGSASAVTAALAAGLVAMVAALSENRPRYAAHAAIQAQARRTGEALVDRLLALADEDAAAYGEFSQALKLPRETAADAADRARAMETSARRAAEVPLRCVEACLDVVAAAESLAGRSNRNASSDLNVAALLAEAAAGGAAANVLVNLPALAEGDRFAEEAPRRVDELLERVRRLAEVTRSVVASGDERDPIAPAAAGEPR